MRIRITGKSNAVCFVFLLLLSVNKVVAGGPATGSNSILFSSAPQWEPKSLAGWRLGMGLGYALYVGDQMDKKITRNFGDFKELRLNLCVGGFRQLNEEKEWGLVYKVGSFQTLKSNNTQGVECHFQEIQSIWQKSLNENVGLHGSWITCNFQYGLGLNYFKSRYFMVNPNYETIDYVRSSVGYGNSDGKTLNGETTKGIPGKRAAFLMNAGLNLGFRLPNNFRLYFENSLQVAVSHLMTGNLEKSAIFPPDAYFFTGLHLYYKFGAGSSKLGCSRRLF